MPEEYSEDELEVPDEGQIDSKLQSELKDLSTKIDTLLKQFDSVDFSTAPDGMERLVRKAYGALLNFFAHIERFI